MEFASAHGHVNAVHFPGHPHVSEHHVDSIGVPSFSAASSPAAASTTQAPPVAELARFMVELTTEQFEAARTRGRLVYAAPAPRASTTTRAAIG
jgi:hypothetical protein